MDLPRLPDIFSQPLDPSVPFPDPGRLPGAGDLVRDYNRLRDIAQRLTDVEFPVLPTDARTRADWGALFKCWFYETTPPMPGAAWFGKDLVKFGRTSPYSADVGDCPGMLEVKQQFFAESDNRPNPWKGKFQFGLKASARPGYYTVVEWFLGSFYPTVTWRPNGDGGYAVDVVVENQSDWHSATRLPQSWKDKIKARTGMEIDDLFTAAPRGQVLKAKLHAKLASIRTGSLLNRLPPNLNVGPSLDQALGKWIDRADLPSYGGTFQQQFYLSAVWTPPGTSPG